MSLGNTSALLSTVSHLIGGAESVIARLNLFNPAQGGEKLVPRRMTGHFLHDTDEGIAIVSRQPSFMRCGVWKSAIYAGRPRGKGEAKTMACAVKVGLISSLHVVHRIAVLSADRSHPAVDHGGRFGRSLPAAAAPSASIGIPHTDIWPRFVADSNHCCRLVRPRLSLVDLPAHHPGDGSRRMAIFAASFSGVAGHAIRVENDRVHCPALVSNPGPTSALQCLQPLQRCLGVPLPSPMAATAWLS